MKKNFLAISIIIFVIIIFFSRLFYPEPQLFYTPDFGRSDIWNLNYPFKHFLSLSLKKGDLPFWSKNIGTGFPLFAEGEIGTLHLPNIVLFGLLPTWLAFNLGYLIMFIINSTGMFFFLRQNGRSHTASLFSSLVFSLSGFFVLHVHHYNLIQSAALLPYLMLTAQNLWEKPNWKNILIFSLLLSQQIFAGFPQTTFITLVGIFLFHLGKEWFKEHTAPIRKMRGLFLAVTIGLLLSAPQLLPTLELTLISNRKNGTVLAQVLDYPYPLIHLASFVAPNIFGTPKDGSYPLFSENWGIYWENSPYIGIIPLIFLLVAIFSKKKSPWDKSMLFLLFSSILLSLGKYTALIVLYLLPGFGSFRVPSRFLLLSAFSIAYLAAVGFDIFLNKISIKIKAMYKHQLLSLMIISIGLADLFQFGFNYHPTVPVSLALQPPETTKFVSQERIYTHPIQFIAWNNVFLTEGWNSISPYLYFKNGLDANLNLIFDLPQAKVYPGGLHPLRLEPFLYEIPLKLINLNSIKFLITMQKLDKEDGLLLLKTLQPPNENLPTYYIYENLEMFDRFRFAWRYKIIYPVRNSYDLINYLDFTSSDLAYLEKDINKTFVKPSTANIDVLVDTDQNLSLSTTTDAESLLIIADSYYPGWQAKINGQPTEIYPANINQRALVVPPGTNLVELQYVPKMFYLGLKIASLTIFILIFQALKDKLFKNNHSP